MPHQLQVDQVFKALSDATRLAVVAQLARGEASASELARPFNMALPSFVQHLGVLEDCGLVSSRKSGRIRTYRLEPRRLDAARHWLDEQRSHWEKRFDQLDQFLITAKDNDHG
ncbi:MAG: metalloregulator ArsR/SmtB family transcription factor [Proteobacteria bacterium]|nr:metalloregulator ArsR/SmtB family transcription factor [Pseudomonadota bacterium]